MVRRIPTTITEKELVEILKKTKCQNHRVAYVLGFYQAMRISEITALRKENVDVEQHLIKIREATTPSGLPKNCKQRHVPIVKPILMSERTVTGACNKLPITCGIRALEMAFNKSTMKALGKRLHFHTLRHSGASWLLNKKKWDIRQVQVFLGHSRIATTEIYAHVNPQDLVELEWGND